MSRLRRIRELALDRQNHDGIKTVEEKGPHTKPDKFRGGLPGSLTNSETESNHKGWSKIKTLAKSSSWWVVMT